MKLAIYSLLALSLPILAFTAGSPDEEAQTQRARSVALFRETLKVFQHPRCLNCHPGGDRPTQGMDMHHHLQNVQRGRDDHGAMGMKCATCHHDANYDVAGVPGAPKWALAPRSMAWQGLTGGEICRAIKDKKKNHGMSLEALVKHSAEDPLVAWGWKPGAGREPVPGTQEEFGRLMAEWVATGAHCPVN